MSAKKTVLVTVTIAMQVSDHGQETEEIMYNLNLINDIVGASELEASPVIDVMSATDVPVFN